VAEPDDAPTQTGGWNVRDRLGKSGVAEIVSARCDGATLVSIANTHGVSVSTVKRLVRTAAITDA